MFLLYSHTSTLSLSLSLSLSKEAGYSFELGGEYVHIIFKTFHDGGADNMMLSHKFSSCLKMKKVHTVQIWSTLHLDDPVKNLRKTAFFIPYKGKRMAYNMHTNIAKSCPDELIRKLFQIHFVLEVNQFSLFKLDDSTNHKEVDIIMSLPLTLQTKSVHPSKFNLFHSPLFPNIEIMENYGKCVAKIGPKRPMLSCFGPSGAAGMSLQPQESHTY